MLRIPPFSPSKLDIYDLSILNSNDCLKENIIYIFKDLHPKFPSEYWKIHLDVFNQLSLLFLLDEDNVFICDESTPLNEKGYVIIDIINGSDTTKSLFILSLIYNIKKFKFDFITLQNIYNNFSEDEKDKFLYNFEQFNIDAANTYNLNYEQFDDEFHEFCLENMDDWGVILPKFLEIANLNERNDEIDNFRLRYQETQKKLNLKYKKRETKYRKLGCEILNGSEALHRIQESDCYSMIALNTDLWYSIEYNFMGEHHLEFFEQHYFTVRRIINGIIVKDTILAKQLDDRIAEYNWAIKKYHSGFEGY